jgi:subtilase family serine protease
VDGQTLDERQLGSLDRGEVRVVEWTAGACGDRVRAVVDASNTVAESIETDNVRAVTCPVPGS